MTSQSQDYFRPRGDITTVLDLTNRDSQDNTYFPIDADHTWFHYKESITHPTAMSIQEFTQRGPADWGQKCTFEIGTLSAGDLFHSIHLQIKLSSWYNEGIVHQLAQSQITTDPSNLAQYWTYCNSLGTSIIEYAEFIVNDQTLERITGEFISMHMNLFYNKNAYFGYQYDAIGTVPYTQLNPSTVQQSPFHPARPFSVEDGTYFCALPFFFSRTKQEVFPLLSCNEGNVRVDIKLRPFEEVVRNYAGYRACEDTPLNKSVEFITTATPSTQVVTTTCIQPPAFQDFRIVTGCSLITGSIREKFLHKPFEQLVKLVQLFSFEEPLKYVVNKSSKDFIEVQLPLELNHPVVEILWVLRRKAAKINNEWSNFTPNISFESSPTMVYPPWVNQATIRINGSEVITAEGDWFKEHIARKHQGGLTAYNASVYGYSFAEYPAEHQPSGTANMSKASSVTLNLRVNPPIVQPLPNADFDPNLGGWEVFVYAMYYNWIRYENGICNKLFSS
jgi:hypothetical protein